ncbi:Predicted arabinose efflux permease, MFS family [Pedobacter steynii]|uniref:Predicted arabinose efflux permease, MFS family n=1 Tax=Pedobacter steynii TaxID=430522 RepID=A0A1G9MXC1_9SPHI|nr:MFS transporter [Pedobacter steynii]NQX39476.1 MFS transporter [Pedobacter steynii]SDL78577.1 Predicted arabinose efflux permease, MFS family [Pedobacter steynii]
MALFRSLKSRNFKLFFYGQSISLIGTWMQKTAVSWLVYQLTGSALLLGVVGFVSLIPSLLLSPYAGSLVDRHNRYRILVITQVASMMQAGALAGIIFFGYHNILLIILLSLIQGIINAFDMTCRQSLMVEMVDDKEDLPNAIALNSTMVNFARIAGPAVAGIILSAFGTDFCFIGNFLSYIPVLICLFMMKLQITVMPKSEKSIWAELEEGFKYVSGDKDLSSMILMLGMSSLFVMPFNTLMPMFAKDIFNGDARTFSWFESAAGLGSIGSAIYLANLKNNSGLIKMVAIAGAILGGSLLFLAYAPQLPFALFFMTLAGVGMMAQTSAINTYIQTHSIPEMRGRAISYYVMAYQGIIPIGSLLIGWAANLIGPRPAIFIEGTIGIMATIAFIIYRSKYSQRKTVSL